MPRTLLSLLSMLLVLALVGCPTGNTDDDDSVDDDDVADDDDVVDDDDAVDPEPPFITGSVEDPAGSALAGIALTLCDENRCLSGATDAAGEFQFSQVPDGDYVIHNLSVPGIEDGNDALLGWSSFYDIVSMVGAVDVDVADPYVVPEVTDTRDLVDGANSLDFGGELILSWDEALSLPFALAGVDPITVGAVKLEPSQYPEVATVMGYEVLAGWAIAPFELALEDDAHFTVEVLAPGLTSADFAILYAHYDVDIATGELSAATGVTNPDGERLVGEVTHLGMVLAVQAL